MEDFKVVIEEAAEKDLFSILAYISETLHEPAAALRIYLAIREAVSGLDHRPFRFQVVEDEEYAARGLRKLLVENYIAFYVVDESANMVHVLRILYNRREWQNLL